eukprot:scaffold1336_cov158-Cylindrotheca_fusiformis.AAC.3
MIGVRFWETGADTCLTWSVRRPIYGLACHPERQHLQPFQNAAIKKESKEKRGEGGELATESKGGAPQDTP